MNASSGEIAVESGAPQREDRLRFETRLLSAIIIPFLVIAFGMLYLLPEHSGELFAWAIAPRMSAMMLGAAYIGGAYFFTRVLFARRWHTIKLGLLPVTAFATYLGIATLIHWDRFNHAHVSFFFWALLYLGLPFLLLTVWYRNGGTRVDPPGPDELTLPAPALRLFWIEGRLLTLVSLALLIVPDLLIPIWPWTLSPLTARVMAAMFVLPGLVGLGINLEKRWSAARIILEAQIIAIVLILLAMRQAASDFSGPPLATGLFVGGMALLCLCLIGVYLDMIRRSRAAGSDGDSDSL